MELNTSDRPVCPNPRCQDTKSMVAVRVEAGIVTKWCCFVCGQQLETPQEGREAT